MALNKILVEAVNIKTLYLVVFSFSNSAIFAGQILIAESLNQDILLWTLSGD